MRLAKRRYEFGDPLPMPGQWCIVAGVHSDITSDQDRAYGRRLVNGYTPCGNFVCLQTEGCWPTVERLTNCWFALPAAQEPST